MHPNDQGHENRVIRGSSTRLWPYGFDYKETFSLAVMLNSIRILPSITTYLDYEIWQMDVNITFLNGNLNETIYMMEPNVIIAKNQEHMICKLHKSIYRLR